MIRIVLRAVSCDSREEPRSAQFLFGSQHYRCTGGSLAVDNGWTQTVSEQQLVDCDTFNHACDSGLIIDFDEKNALCTELSVTTP